jgi:hypothetical protein
MIDTRALAQEVQDQLLAAKQRGQQQFRKSQDQMRKSQDQVRKSREAVAEVIRNGNQLAKAFRPSIPALPVRTVRIPSLSTPADRAKLRASAQELADQVVATQRNIAVRALQVTSPLAEQVVATQRQLAGKALQAASPIVAERVAQLTHVVGTLPGMRRFGLADGVAAPEAVAASEAADSADIAIAEFRRPTTAAAESAPARARASKPRTPRASTTQADGTSKAASTTRADGTRKPRATKAVGTTKTASTTQADGTSKAGGARKPRATRAAGTTRSASTSKPRSTKK